MGVPMSPMSGPVPSPINSQMSGPVPSPMQMSAGPMTPGTPQMTGPSVQGQMGGPMGQVTGQMPGQPSMGGPMGQVAQQVPGQPPMGGPMVPNIAGQMGAAGPPAGSIAGPMGQAQPMVYNHVPSPQQGGAAMPGGIQTNVPMSVSMPMNMAGAGGGVPGNVVSSMQGNFHRVLATHTLSFSYWGLLSSYRHNGRRHESNDGNLSSFPRIRTWCRRCCCCRCRCRCRIHERSAYARSSWWLVLGNATATATTTGTAAR